MKPSILAGILGHCFSDILVGHFGTEFCYAGRILKNDIDRPSAV